MCRFDVDGDVTISFRPVPRYLDGRARALADWDHDLVIVDAAMTREARLQALIDLMRSRLADPAAGFSIAET